MGREGSMGLEKFLNFRFLGGASPGYFYNGVVDPLDGFNPGVDEASNLVGA